MSRPGDDDAHAAGQALGGVLGGLAPHGAGEEQAVAVLPLPPVAVSQNRGGVLATRNLATGWPAGVNRSSGSSTRLPTRVIWASFIGLGLPALLGFRVWHLGFGALHPSKRGAWQEERAVKGAAGIAQRREDVSWAGGSRQRRSVPVS